MNAISRIILTGILLSAGAAWAEAPAPVSPTHAATGNSPAELASRRLKEKWFEFYQRNAQRIPPAKAIRAEQVADDSVLPLPQRKSVARKSEVPFQAPPVINSKKGVLTAVLEGEYANNHIGADPVFLRSYNGMLTGPTLRAKPGDTLKIALRNQFPTQVEHPGTMNTLNLFNTMNLHTHGLHVSPNGNSDNVLLDISPKGSQDYEVHIPKDHPAGTFWYHAHRHGSTAGDVGSGLSGAIIIEGGLDDVPQIRKAEDRIFVLQQIPYLYNNVITNISGSLTQIDIFTNIGTAGKITCVTNTDAGTTITCTHYGYVKGVVEEEDEDFIFGPGTWETLGRYTTVNGLQVPLIKVHPGSVERWRFIDAGVREEVALRLVRATQDGSNAPETIAFHEIADDGLALGTITTTNLVDLWPGYRSDVLVKFPDVAGDYLLIDDYTDDGLQGGPESLKYVARIRIEGTLKPMELPVPLELAQYRLPSILTNKVDNHREMLYGIFPQGNGVVFTVNGLPFDMDRSVNLTLGDTDEWTVISTNGVGPVSHPFHIHVNPFEVISMKDTQGVERLVNGPVWRDTLIMHEGWTNVFRTHYTDYPGLFVQHCHILDHEDQGMMLLVQILEPDGSAAKSGQVSLPGGGQPVIVRNPYPAPKWELPDSTAGLKKLDDYKDHPVLLVFFEGHQCLRCAEQISLLTQAAGEFQKRGIQVVGISSDSVEGLRKSLETAACPFPLVADPDGKVFRQYGCYAGGPLHGAFLLDTDSAVRWQTVSTKPYMSVETVLRQADILLTPNIGTK